MTLDLGGRGGAVLQSGCLVEAWAAGGGPGGRGGGRPVAVELDLDLDLDVEAVAASNGPAAWAGEAGASLPLPTDLADELACVATWLEANAGRVRVVSCERGIASPLPRLPPFTPASRPPDRR